jgi:hypothetical protein
VTSWRDSASSSAQDDLDALFNAALDAAEGMLSKHGEFFPFGVEAGGQDQVALFSADPGLGGHPPSAEVLQALAEGARSERERLQAAALVSDVTLGGGGDAVRVQLEHHEGVVLEIVVPYRRRRFGGKVTFGEMAVSDGDRRIWIE